MPVSRYSSIGRRYRYRQVWIPTKTCADILDALAIALRPGKLSTGDAEEPTKLNSAEVTAKVAWLHGLGFSAANAGVGILLPV